MLNIEAVKVLNEIKNIVKEQAAEEATSLGASIYKEHIHKFGVEPNIIYRGSLEDPELIMNIKQAMDRNIPYDELDTLTPQEQKLYEQGVLKT